MPERIVPESIVIVGGGVGGLAAALALSRAGHPVTVLERDPLPPTADVEEAFAAERRGAPQVHQTHGMLARLVLVLRERFPDVLADLHALGCTTWSLAVDLGEPRPGDDDLSVLVVRRTTLEWVLRRAVLAEANTEVRTGVGVVGLTGIPAGDDSTLPTATGVRLEDGSTIAADAVIASTGRRGAVPVWLAELGVTVPEVVHESGLMYLTRWYRVPEGFTLPRQPKLAGDLGFLKYLGIPGDGGTFSVTLAVRVADAEVRTALSDPDRFDAACRHLEGPSYFFGHGPVEPLTGVLPMGGLINRIRRFVDDDDQPTALGVHAIGDAHTCTNPLYGRGCSLALVQAVALADAFAAHPGDPAARAVGYEAVSRREVEPWFDISVQMDAMGADPAGKRIALPGAGEAGKAIAAVFAAGATDPVIGRGILRMMNLLATPTDLMADPEFVTAVMAVMADPDRVAAAPLAGGPTRAELLASLASLAA